MVSAALLVVAVVVLPPRATAYSGALSSNDLGILGTGNWIEVGPTTLKWDVTENPDHTWHYSYTFTHPEGTTSHFIIETSDNFTAGDISGASGNIGEIDIGMHTAGEGGNPTMPEDVYGIKFGAAGLSTHIEFDSTRLPMWGDFYAKDGQAGGYGLNSAWNAGFTAPDSDPELPVQDGSIENHILVPDTHYSPVESASWTGIKSMYR
jgi:hypothetical protein